MVQSAVVRLSSVWKTLTAIYRARNRRDARFKNHLICATTSTRWATNKTDMERKVKTIDLKGKAYAQVKDRLKQFREENPRGLVETFPTIQPDGRLLFKARIVKDKADEGSAEATGHALGKDTGEKAFEKTETIAVGRALALLGYAMDGEIASDEEMEEFYEHKQEKHREAVLELRARLEDAKDLKELARIWADIPMSEAKKEVDAYKTELKLKLTPKTEDHGA